jgi:PAS domain S-box-containing protein
VIQNFVTQQLELLGKCVPDLLLVLDPGGVIVFANRGRGPIAREDLVGRKIQSLYLPGEVEGADVAIAEVMLTGGTARLEVHGRVTDGPETTYSQRMSAIEENGTVIGIMLMESDVTEKLKLAEEVELERAKAMHATKFATLGEMASNIAHEINTPLAHIQLLSEMLRERIDKGSLDPNELRGISDQIDTTLTRITRTVKSLRSFARQAEGDPFVCAPIAEIVGETLELMRERMHTEDVELKFEPIPGDLMVECRSTQITQVLLNLCSNAVDAIAGREARWLKVEVQDLGISVEISVTDSGPPIPREVREKIMQPFFTTKPSGKGTGLGLSVSKGIAGYHHGLLYLDELSTQTRFVLLLPKNQPAASAA